MLDKDIARLQDRIDEAGESAKISTKHALYHAKKERAALEIVKSVSKFHTTLSIFEAEQ